MASTIRSFDTSTTPHPAIHRLLVGGVAPRPIALVSSMDADGNSNLSPFSFFNVFGVNPAVCCFSPAFSGRTGQPKHTMMNLDETSECTVSIVTRQMVEQISLASAPYEQGVDEFTKSGLTKRESTIVKPPAVAESPFVMEAQLLHHLDFGRTPGSANMMVCEILMIHVNEEILNETGGIDPVAIDQVARMGGAYYTRAKEGLFVLPQPSVAYAGVDRLPEEIKLSSVLTGKHLAQLASRSELPQASAITWNTSEAAHRRAAEHLESGDIDSAWSILGSE